MMEVEFDGFINEKENLDRECAEWIFGTGLALTTVDHPLFKKFIRSLITSGVRGEYDTPPSWKLGGAMNSNVGGIKGSLSDILRNQGSGYEEKPASLSGDCEKQNC